MAMTSPRGRRGRLITAGGRASSSRAGMLDPLAGPRRGRTGHRRRSQKLAHLVRRQVPELSRLEPAARERSDGDTLELRDRMARGLEQPPHLVVLAFMERQLEPGVV